MFRLTLKSLAAKKVRLFSTALAVFLGVAFMAGTLILTDTMNRTLSGLVTDADAGTDVYVRATSAVQQQAFASRPRTDVAIADQVAHVPGVKAVATRVSGYAQLVDKNGKAVGDLQNGAPTIGGNWISVAELNPYRLSEGRAPVGDNEVVIDADSANQAHYHVGDQATVLSKQAPRPVTIVGIAKFGSAKSMGGVSSVMFNDTIARFIFAQPSQVDGVAVVAAEGVSQADLTARIAAAMPAGVEAITGKALADEDSKSVTEDLKFFKTFMLVFAGIALLVGAFIIANTFSILVAQRTKELALLRAIGASRRQVQRSVLIESALTGVVASALGLAAGFGIARALQMLLDALGMSLPAGGAVLTTGTIVVSVLTGVGVTVVSAVLPARRASRVAPVEAMRDAAAESVTISKPRMIKGAVTASVGLVALVAGVSKGEFPLVVAGSLGVQVGLSRLSPLLVRGVVKVFGWPLRRFSGTQGLLAGENALRNPKRTTSTAAALRIGVALVVAITVFASSVRASVSHSVRNDLTGEYIVDSGAFGVGGISPQMARDLKAVPQVSAVASTRMATVKVDGETVEPFNGWSPDVNELFHLGVTAGSVNDLGADGLAVSKSYAQAHHWAVGSIVPVTFAATGEHPFTVKAIYDRSTDIVGGIFTSTEALEANQPDQLDSTVYVKLANGVSVESARPALEAITGQYPAGKLLTKTAYVESINANVDTMLTLIYALLALAVLIALVGIANTLALSTFERRRELGLLRAVGMSRSQVRSMVRQEATLISTFGAVMGLGIGVLFGWALVTAMASKGVTQLVFPATNLIVVTLVAVAAGVFASLRPARRAARLDVLSAIASA